MTDATAQTWSVIIATEGHPEHDPGTTYIHWTFGLTRDAALQVVSEVEHEADDALDDCGCEASDLDGEIRHECSGYPIVSAFVCLDADSGKYFEKPRFHIASAPRDGTVIIVGHPDVGEAIVRWDEDLVNHFVGNYPGIWVRIDRSATWIDHPEFGPSYWRAA